MSKDRYTGSDSHDKQLDATTVTFLEHALIFSAALFVIGLFFWIVEVSAVARHPQAECDMDGWEM